MFIIIQEYFDFASAPCRNTVTFMFHHCFVSLSFILHYLEVGGSIPTAGK